MFAIVYYVIDNQLIIFGFELKFLVFRHVFIRGFWNPVCPYHEKKKIINISLTLVIDTWLERSLWVLQHWNPEILFLF